ncbi:MAG: radical SAM protein [Bacteroidales bacterium]|nr:radical SAM protein [Bacteroidales bacterium]
MKNFDDIFETALKFHHYANTAYPLTPFSLRQYELHDNKAIYDCVSANIKQQKKLNLYVHVPFCETRCRFCEYVVLDKPNPEDQDIYTQHLLKEIEMYRKMIGDIPIVGYDMGGGTPAYLSNENLKLITDSIKKFNLAPNMVMSIETTPVIAVKNPQKIEYIKSLGYKRISMGFQTVNSCLLERLNREGGQHIYDKAVENIRKAGFKNLNIDLMYGFLNQSNDDFRNTVRYTISKNPEYITLYRNRYKGTKLEAEAGGVSLYKANVQYNIAYQELKKAGYIANNGKNTFSKVPGDYGTSDYLTTRVVDATSYVGFGLGAQSFVGNYLAYNLGCDNHKLNKYFDAIDNNILPINDIADMPIEEVRAKALSVMFYFGFISQKSYKNRFGNDFKDDFKDEIKYLQENGLMDFTNDDPDKFMITNYGVEHLPGIISLFYSQRSQNEMFELIKKKYDETSYDEIFLKNYNRKEFDAPSVATDIVLISKDKKKVLLITRSENPFVNKLALPGGFYRPDDESIKSCAIRELNEETSTAIASEQLKFIKVCDKPNRDPRGWIISMVYSAMVDDATIKPKAGDDAVYARWYNISDLTKEQLAFDHWDTIQEVISL